MSKKLLMNNHSENGFEWDYEKKSEKPVPLSVLCPEYVNGNNINLNTFSNNQVLEVDISRVSYSNGDPQLMLLVDKNKGGKVYWNEDGLVIRVGNTPSFYKKLSYPTTLKLTLIDNIFSLYIDEILQISISTYTSQWLPFAGAQGSGRITATGFRYKNFEKRG